jgi:hypothetical protein
MRLSPAHRVGTLVLLFVGVAHAEAPEGSQRFVRTSLEAAPVLEYRSPPRVITASLDQHETEVLGAASAPRQLRRSLDDSLGDTAASNAVAGTTVAEVGERAAVDGNGWVVSANAAPANEVAPAAVPEGDAAGYGALECDCARTRRQIRLTLDGAPAVPAPESTRIIRVQL